MLRITPLLFAAVLVAQPAQAAVTYSWQQVASSDSMPPGLNLELVFSDAAVAKGSLELDFMNLCDLGEPCLDQQDSLLSLRYWYEEPFSGDYRHNYIDYGYRQLPQKYYDKIRLNVSFLPGGLLSGDIFATDGHSHFEMESSGTLFTVLNAHSDEPFGCAYDRPACTGSTGLLASEPNRGEVPEPSSVMLAGLGLGAAWLARRRKRLER